MTDYIKRTDAVKIAEKYGLANGSVLGRHTGLADCIARDISELPAADVAEVVHGTPVTKARTRTIVGYHEEIGVLAGDRSTLYRRNMCMWTSRMTTARCAAQRCARGGIISAGNAARRWMVQPNERTAV